MVYTSILDVVVDPDCILLGDQAQAPLPDQLHHRVRFHLRVIPNCVTGWIPALTMTVNAT
ncbi:hypothetical protein DPMN_193195 [Dreissena polymorpha]|uniref:Uncharacterized protein n=1 Tax=Dreissena polymorpha TaxID=45954 RepID=A0A9D3Y096_DREPO|nr:hypothetical protein DPMN_193195 [Dreissena polymorpha]